MNIRRLSIALCGMLFAALPASAQKADNSQSINGHKFVDLGLPSGLLWAETNIGAEDVAGEGIRFAWGETSMTEKEDFFDIKYYKYYSGNSSGELFTKYNKADKKTTLDKEDDAAHVNWGAPCRMPTHNEVKELSNPKNCTWTWVSFETKREASFSGYKVTSKKNGNSIFILACGSPFDGCIEDYGLKGEYWTGTVFIDEDGTYNYARTVSFDKEEHKNSSCPVRFNGLPVRPVVSPRDLPPANNK